MISADSISQFLFPFLSRFPLKPFFFYFNATVKTLDDPKFSVLNCGCFKLLNFSRHRRNRQEMTKSHMGTLCFFLSLLGFANFVVSQTGIDDPTMQALKSSLNLNKDVDWSNPNPCKWETVQCDGTNRVTRIQLNQKGIRGTLPPDLQKLTELTVLELFQNQISGPIPDLSGLTRLQTLNLHDNLFDSVPKSLFSDMNSLQEAYLENNPFSPWQIPDTIKETTRAKNS